MLSAEGVIDLKTKEGMQNFQINILKIIKLLELWQLRKRKRKK